MVGSLSDLQRFAGKRLAQDWNLDDATWRQEECERLLSDARQAIMDKADLVEKKNVEIIGLEKELSDERWYRDRADKKAKRRGPWALIGKLAVGVVAVRGGAELYRMVVR